MNKKYLAFLFLFFIGTGLILPNQNLTLANGDWVQDYLENPTMGFEEGSSSWAEKYLDPLIKGFFAATISGIFAVAIAITSAFLGLGQFLLNIVVSPTFINIPFTNNPFVNEGLKVTKDLTNILIVIGLVAIALATILRITSYEMKKTLPLLLIVALLINFTPVFCGVAIDASNIMMNHFLKGGGLLTGGFISKLSTEISMATDKEDPAAALGKGASVLGFNIFGGLIFLLFAMIFLFRYVALWMLIILSPLALFCIIFPRTKSMWNMWLSQFMQWCFIGIPIAFTIHLANIMTVELVEKGGIEGVSGGAEILGYLVPLVFLIFGFFMSLQIGAMGANIATTWSKRIGKLSSIGAEKGSRKVRENIGKGLATKKMGAHEIGSGGKREKARGGLLGWAGRGLVANVERHEREEAEDAKKKAKGKSFGEQDALLHSLNATTRIQTLQTIIEEGNIDKLGKATGFSKKDEEKIMRDTLKFFPSLFKNLAKSEIKIAEKIVGKTGKDINDNLAKKAGIFMDEKDIKKYKTVSQKLASTASEKDISKWSEETMKTALSSKVFHESLKGSKISAMAKQFGDDFFEAFRDNVAGEQWYIDNASAAHKYISNTGGKNLGVDFAKEHDRKPGPSHEETTQPITETRTSGATSINQNQQNENVSQRNKKVEKGEGHQYENISPKGKERPNSSNKKDESGLV